MTISQDLKLNLPETWIKVQLSQIAAINPKLNKACIDDNLLVSFVPMPAVKAECGDINVSQSKVFSEVKKGYTPFQEKDVLFAKITPCMENGKMAIVPKLINNLGFGSTEFHVFRSFQNILPEFIYYYVSSKLFRFEAEHHMTGAVGQRRVPTTYLSNAEIPLPPLNEQKRIVEKIEELFSELDDGIESLKTAQAKLKIYRQALLKQAFEGKLTEQWRKENADKLESAEDLLARIKQEREARYEQQLTDWKTAVKQWESQGKPTKKPSKPKKIDNFSLSAEQSLSITELPENWIWLRYGGLCEIVRNGISKKPEGDQGTKIFRISAVRPLFFDMKDYRFIDNTKGEFDTYFLSKGDLVFTRYNGSRKYVGVCAEYKSDEKRLFPDKLVQTRLGILSIKASFLEKALSTGESRKYVESYIRTTAGQSGISGEDIKNIPVPVCSPIEQELILEILDNKLSGIENIEHELKVNLKKSEILRQSILKKAFSGQLVPQDPNDEPASVLLERIKQEQLLGNSKQLSIDQI